MGIKTTALFLPTLTSLKMALKWRELDSFFDI
jgi:hypothetical protein